MTKLYFDCRDLLRAVRLGWSGKKMGLSFLGLIIAYLGYAILSYVALLAGGQGFGEIWRTYDLYPWICGAGVPWYTWVIYVVGILFAIVVLFRYATAVAKITYRQLKGDDFYSMGDARKYVKKNWKATVLSPLVLLGMIVFLVVCGIIIGLLGKIPFVGELGFSLGFLFIFVVSLFVMFLGIVFFVSTILTPAIVGITGEDTLETVIQLFSTVWSQPWRLVLYEALLKIYTVLATVILTILSFKAVLLIYWACGWGMGEKMAQIASVAVRLLPTKCPLWGGLIGLFGDPCLPEIGTTAGIGGTVLVSGGIAGIMLVLLLFFVLSYSFSICCAGQSLIYLILRKKKDDENLLEKKDQEEEEEEREREEEERKREEEKKKEEEAEKEEELKEEEKAEKEEAVEEEEKAEEKPESEEEKQEEEK